MADKPIQVDLKNERAIVATMAKDSDARRRLALELAPTDFGDARHRVMFSALRDMSRRGLAWSEDALAELAGGKDFGDFVYLRRVLADYEPVPPENLPFHVERMRFDAVRLELLTGDLPAIVDATKSSETTPAELVAAGRRIANRAENVKWGRPFKGAELKDRYVAELCARGAVGDIAPGTGFERIDAHFTRRFVPGLGAVVGRPGHGKSTFMAALIRRRLHAKLPTYLCGWEMDEVDYLDMIVAGETGISTERLSHKVGELTDDENRRIAACLAWATNKDLLAIERNPFKREKGLKPWEANEKRLDHFLATICRVARDYPLVVVDVFNKMLIDPTAGAVSQALIAIREEAKSNGTFVLELNHIKREGADGPPRLEDIKGSGAWEEECDVVWGCDRPWFRCASPTKRKKLRDTLDVYTLKQRKGPAPYCVRFDFHGATADLDHERDHDVSALERTDD